MTACRYHVLCHSVLTGQVSLHLYTVLWCRPTNTRPVWRMNMLPESWRYLNKKCNIMGMFMDLVVWNHPVSKFRPHAHVTDSHDIIIFKECFRAVYLVILYHILFFHLPSSLPSLLPFLWGLLFFFAVPPPPHHTSATPPAPSDTPHTHIGLYNRLDKNSLEIASLHQPCMCL